jgi:hypothetical protein
MKKEEDAKDFENKETEKDDIGKNKEQAAKEFDHPNTEPKRSNRDIVR